jgi:hypothetical protein
VSRRIALAAATILLVGTTAGPGATTVGTRLAIVLYPRGDASGGARRFTLQCDPAGGTVPAPPRACRALTRLRAPFAPVLPTAICTQIAGGPQQAAVSGRLRGRAVRARLSLRNGCEIERWRRLAAVVPGFAL